VIRTPRVAPTILVAILAMLATACGATATWVPVEAGETAESDAPAELAFAPEAATADKAVKDTTVDQGQKRAATKTDPQAEEDPVITAASERFCAATSNSWIHSAALNRIGANGNTEMNRVAMANVAEWLERATLLAPEDTRAERDAMFAAFTQLQLTVAADFDNDWNAFQNSSDYANSEPAQTYEASRSALIPFLSQQCSTLSITDVSAAATARTQELVAEFGTAASTLVESESLPGHAIFTHGSGRLIASFPSAWSHQENAIAADSDAIVDLVASPKVDRFLNNEAVDGVRLQLVEADTLDDFATKIDATMIATGCTRTDELSEPGLTRVNITQTFVCPDHSATIVGQYSQSRALGLIIEASFDSPQASRTDLIRLASIATSALWS